MKLLTICLIGAMLLAAARAVAVEAQSPMDVIIERAIPTKEVGPNWKTNEAEHSDRVKKFDARKQAVETLQNELEAHQGGPAGAGLASETFAAAFSKEQDKVSKSDNAEPLIVLGLAVCQAHPEELDKFLTRLITTRDTNADLRVEAAKMAAFHDLPAAQQAAHTAILDKNEPETMRFYLLRGVLRGSPAGKLGFVRQIADGKGTESKLLIGYARDSLAAVKEAGKIKRDAPVALCDSLARAVRASDTKTLVALNGKPTIKPQSVQNAAITDSPQVQLMLKFLTGFASNETNWIVLYDTAACWNNDFEMILRQECGLWYVELGIPTPWNQ